MSSIIVSKAAKCGTENRPFRRAAEEASVANQVHIIQADIGCDAESTHYGLKPDLRLQKAPPRHQRGRSISNWVGIAKRLTL